MSRIVTNFQTEFYLNIAPKAAAKNFQKFGKGYSDVNKSSSDVTYDGSFLSDQGYSSKYVTGGGMGYSYTGVRFIGDPVQDYIHSAAVMYNFADARNTDFKVVNPDGSQNVGECTLSNIQELGGAANEAAAVSVDITINGKPSYIPAPTNPPVISESNLTIAAGSDATFTVDLGDISAAAISCGDTEVATVAPTAITNATSGAQTITVTGVAEGTASVAVSFNGDFPSATITISVTA